MAQGFSITRMTAYFISDLHLSPKRPDITASLKGFIDHHVIPEKAELYILGDLFEYWIGDDVAGSFTAEITAMLQQVTGKHRLKCYFMPGNRDFLINSQFCQRYGITLLSDPSVITIGSSKILLMHGDSLCTKDKWYQRYRKLVHCKLIQRLFLATPQRFREYIASSMRAGSKKHTPGKSYRLYDVDNATVKQIMLKYGVPLLIHGHTHRAALHTYKINDEIYQRLVLGDWGKKNWVLRIQEDKMEFMSADCNDWSHASGMITD